jgi:hypothetical protein
MLGMQLAPEGAGIDTREIGMYETEAGSVCEFLPQERGQRIVEFHRDDTRAGLQEPLGQHPRTRAEFQNGVARPRRDVFHQAFDGVLIDQEMLAQFLARP